MLEKLNTYFQWIPNSPSQRAVLFDIETNGLLDALTRCHCIVLKDTASGRVFSAHEPQEIQEALRILEEAPVIVAHNAIRFDVPALKKLYDFKPKGQVLDTLVALRLLHGDGDDFKAKDWQAMRRKRGGYRLPAALVGRHSLAAWGYRLGVLKGDYGAGSDWQSWSSAMQAYCEQDVQVLEAVYAHLFQVGFSPEALALEMAFAEIIQKQIEHGFPFDEAAAAGFYGELCAEREALLARLQAAFPPLKREEVFIPRRDNKTRGYVTGVPFIKTWEEPFNPSSRKQVAERLKQRHGWEPTEYTPTGEPKIDDDLLGSLPYPEAALLARWYKLNKITGMVAEGQNGWLKLVRPHPEGGRIHGDVNTNGAITGRCTHSRPNLAQVPKGGELGARCRACFAAPPGWVMVGADASGLELRMFGHFVARYDGGKYISIVLDGDVHSANQQAAGLPTRDNAKTFIYAYLYGAGDVKLGSIIKPHASPPEQRAVGARLRKRFETKLPALKRLREAIQAAVSTRGFLYGLDKRRLSVRSSHAALNVVLQSAGAVLVKLATVVWHWKVAEAGYEWGRDWAQVAHVHDECQAIVRTYKMAEHIGRLFAEALEVSGEHFGLRCPTTGEYKIGRNWKETH